MTVEHQTSILKERDRVWGRNLFVCASSNRNHKTLSNSIEIAKQILSDDEIKSMIMEKDKKSRNILNGQFADVDLLKNCIVALKKFLNDKEIVQMILSVDNDGDHFLTNAVTKIGTSLEVVHAMFDVLKDFLSAGQQKQLMKLRNKENQNIFSLSSWQLNEDHKFEPFTEILVRNASKIVSDDEVRAMLEQGGCKEMIDKFNEIIIK